jgi:hypothetical protein
MTKRAAHDLVKTSEADLRKMRAELEKAAIEAEGDGDLAALRRARARIAEIDAARAEREWAARANAFWDDE